MGDSQKTHMQHLIKMAISPFLFPNSVTDVWVIIIKGDQDIEDRCWGANSKDKQKDEVIMWLETQSEQNLWVGGRMRRFRKNEARKYNERDVELPCWFIGARWVYQEDGAATYSARQMGGGISSIR